MLVVDAVVLCVLVLALLVDERDDADDDVEVVVWVVEFMIVFAAGMNCMQRSRQVIATTSTTVCRPCTISYY